MDEAILVQQVTALL